MAHHRPLTARLASCVVAGSLLAASCNTVAAGAAGPTGDPGRVVNPIRVQEAGKAPGPADETSPPRADDDMFRFYHPRPQPRDGAPETGQRDGAPSDDGPGCPANKRPLDLLV